MDGAGEPGQTCQEQVWAALRWSGGPNAMDGIRHPGPALHKKRHPKVPSLIGAQGRT